MQECRKGGLSAGKGGQGGGIPGSARRARGCPCSATAPLSSTTTWAMPPAPGSIRRRPRAGGEHAPAALALTNVWPRRAQSPLPAPTRARASASLGRLCAPGPGRQIAPNRDSERLGAAPRHPREYAPGRSGPRAAAGGRPAVEHAVDVMRVAGFSDCKTRPIARLPCTWIERLDRFSDCKTRPIARLPCIWSREGTCEGSELWGGVGWGVGVGVTWVWRGSLPRPRWRRAPSAAWRADAGRTQGAGGNLGGGSLALGESKEEEERRQTEGGRREGIRARWGGAN